MRHNRERLNQGPWLSLMTVLYRDCHRLSVTNFIPSLRSSSCLPLLTPPYAHAALYPNLNFTNTTIHDNDDIPLPVSITIIFISFRSTCLYPPVPTSSMVQPWAQPHRAHPATGKVLHPRECLAHVTVAVCEAAPRPDCSPSHLEQ